MLPDAWLAFVVASAVLLLIPGPTNLLVLSNAMTHGRAAARATVAGVALGDLCAMSASTLGLGTLLATSAKLFTAVKVAGALYLIVLGVRFWRTPVAEHDGAALPHPSPRGSRIMAGAWAVAALNPKTIVFFVAFLPQFIDPERSLPGQVLVLVATFITLSVLNATMFGYVASLAHATIRRARTQRLLNRIGGGLIAGSGLLALAWRR